MFYIVIRVTQKRRQYEQTVLLNGSFSTPAPISIGMRPASQIRHSFWYPAHAPLRTTNQVSVTMKILSLSTDQELSQLRKTVLEAAGHEVIALTSDKEAVKAASAPEHFDVVLVCHRFPSATARQIVRLLRQSHPDTRIIYIVHVYGEWPEVEADRYIVGADGPDAMIRVLEEVQV